MSEVWTRHQLVKQEMKREQANSHLGWPDHIAWHMDSLSGNNCGHPDGTLCPRQLDPCQSSHFPEFTVAAGAPLALRKWEGGISLTGASHPMIGGSVQPRNIQKCSPHSASPGVVAPACTGLEFSPVIWATFLVGSEPLWVHSLLRAGLICLGESSFVWGISSARASLVFRLSLLNSSGNEIFKDSDPGVRTRAYFQLSVDSLSQRTRLHFSRKQSEQSFPRSLRELGKDEAGLEVEPESC